MVDELGSSDVFVGGLENIDGNLVASGSISQHDLVEFTANDYEVQTNAGDGTEGYGIALYGVSDGEALAVATNGAEVVAKIDSGDGSGVSPGDLVTSNGSTGTAGTLKAVDTAGDEIVGKAKTGDNASDEFVLIIGMGGEHHG